MSTSKSKPQTRIKHFAVIGAGLAGVVCARTLVQAGHQVTLFEKSRGVGGTPGGRGRFSKRSASPPRPPSPEE